MNSKQPISEKDLVIRLKAGDEKSFALLYDAYKGKLYGNLLRLVKDEEIARELMQDVFVKLWQKRDELDPEKSIGAFLFRVAENKAIDFFRKAARDRKLEAMLVAVATEHYSHIEEGIYQKETMASLEQAIKKLPPQRQRIFRLIKLEGKTYDEVGQLLGLTRSTINDHIVKATRSVKEQLFLSGDFVKGLVVVAFVELL
ncbi:RNA polymerase sigma factor [Negadavirga shengliensis]|uniref:RNA polymerase sigma factor n=1 Tax=Negadavirga shengliensis TaxID=1389218 RepID=A0ABV9T0Y8_9BACT